MIDAFNSTLEEIFYADLILLVFDCSDALDVIKMKLKTCMDILLPKMESQSLFVVANKIDLINDATRQTIWLEVQKIVYPYSILFVSAKSGEGVEELRIQISIIEKRTCIIDAILPLSNQTFGFLSRLRGTCEVRDEVVKNEVYATIKCKEEECQKILGLLSKAGALEKSHHPTISVNEDKLGEKASRGSEGAPLTEE